MGNAQNSSSVTFDSDEENAFVDAFIMKERRERYKEKLANPKKRREFLRVLNNSPALDNSLATEISGAEKSTCEILYRLVKLGLKETDAAYIISDSPRLDGQRLPLSRALDEVLFEFWGSVLCCKKGQIAFYKSETPDLCFLLVKAAKGKS